MKSEIEAITDFAVAEGAVAHHFFFLVPTGRAVTIEAETLKAQAYEDTLTRILNKQKEVSIELKPTCAPQFMRIAKQMGMKMRFGRGCLAGTSYCIISPKGQVQPCAYLNIPLGDVRETPFDEIWRNNEVLNELRTLNYKGGCGECPFKNKLVVVVVLERLIIMMVIIWRKNHGVYIMVEPDKNKKSSVSIILRHYFL